MKKESEKKIKGISAFNYRDVGWIPNQWDNGTVI